VFKSNSVFVFSLILVYTFCIALFLLDMKDKSRSCGEVTFILYV
jgi:hypothetical protein